MTKFLTMLAAMAVTVLAAGCGTPQPLLDQANNGAALTMALDSEVQNFRTVQAAVAKARTESIRRQLKSLATFEADAAFDERIAVIAGDTASAVLFTTIRNLSDSRAADARALQEKLGAIDKTLGDMLAPLPESSKNLRATQKALAEIGEELSAKDRLKAALSFAKTIKKTVDDNKEKIDKASDETPVAKAPPPVNVTAP